MLTKVHDSSAVLPSRMNDEPHPQGTKTVPGGERTNGNLGRSWATGQHKKSADVDQYDGTVRL